MKLTLLKNVAVQLLGIGLQVATASSVNLGGWQKVVASAGIGAVQAAVAAAGQKRNPDGTPATEPFKPKRRKARRTQHGNEVESETDGRPDSGIAGR